jgi:hypothetical protein
MLLIINCLRPKLRAKRKSDQKRIHSFPHPIMNGAPVQKNHFLYKNKA